MIRQRTIEQTYLECDGCQYLLGDKDAMIVVSVPFDYPLEWLRGEEPGTLDFHFHALEQRHDCFRYWAHSPRIMCRSLTERGLAEEQVEDFMALMLYRETPYGPGVGREVAPA